jgi:hypothetical protein
MIMPLANISIFEDFFVADVPCCNSLTSLALLHVTNILNNSIVIEAPKELNY